MQFVRGKTYEAELQLTGMDQFATNSMVLKKFAELGFQNISVSGSGKQRTARGTYMGQTVDVPLPETIKNVNELAHV